MIDRHAALRHYVNHKILAVYSFSFFFSLFNSYAVGCHPGVVSRIG